MRGLLLLAATLMIFLAGSADEKTAGTNKEKPFVLLQLFTSQGCSSCPPADKLLTGVRSKYKHQNVFVLSYHVDYWNRLGWKDPFSKKQFSDLQYRYGSKFGSRSVYTPQVVVNGEEHFVGSNINTMNTKIMTYLNKPADNAIELSIMTGAEDGLDLSYSIQGDLADLNLNFSIVISDQTTLVSRGENRNQNLENSNIVISETGIRARAEGKLRLIWPSEYRFQENKFRLIAYTTTKDLSVTSASEIKL